MVEGKVDKVWKLLENKDSWIRGYMAARRVDWTTTLLDPTPAQSEAGYSGYNCWCLVGAIHKVYSPTRKQAGEIYDKILEKLKTLPSWSDQHHAVRREFWGDSSLGADIAEIENWNDDPDRTHDEVFALCKDLDI